MLTHHQFLLRTTKMMKLIMKGMEFISGWSTCIDEMQSYQKMCDELDKYLEEIIQRNENDMNQSLDQLAKFSSSGGRFNFMKSYLFKHFKPSIYHSKGRSCYDFLLKIIAPVFDTMIQIENIFIEIRVNLDSYQHDVTASEDKIREYHDEWNTIHINDYQNWLYKLDIMRDFSEGKIATITEPQPQLPITKIVEEKKLISNENIHVSRNNDLCT
ncbi:hypothetical protein C1645_844658 [Glomus cerebriforme]|uniref:Uncharacterized protein n=1 Tax=Glomus cerebriforme TaxID=658196 RepID=A0A397S1E4_9GLOM|nr:hypothetical protein C1645_844658 [Glomus cerebriforme]